MCLEGRTVLVRLLDEGDSVLVISICIAEWNMNLDNKERRFLHWFLPLFYLNLVIALLEQDDQTMI
jgi:hypothetical protein